MGGEWLTNVNVSTVGNRLKNVMCKGTCLIVMDGCNTGNWYGGTSGENIPKLLAKSSGCNVLAAGGFFDSSGSND